MCPLDDFSVPSPTHFEPNKQTWKLFKDQVLRFTFTGVLVASYIACLKGYQVRNNVSHASKEVFNTITTVISLALGLNFLVCDSRSDMLATVKLSNRLNSQEAFKDMAKVLRWRVLANRAFSIREADLILGGESLMKLLQLMWESKRKPLTVFVCTAWASHCSIRCVYLG